MGFIPFYAMFHGQHCLGYPLDLFGNEVKPEDTRYPMVPYTPPLPQPTQPLPFTYESVPPPELQISLALYFFNTGQCLHAILDTSTPP